MKFNFRKIASVLSSAVMISSTVALAAAASYPAPFINNGASDVAVVWGSTATLDSAAVNDLVANLNSKITSTTGTVTTVTGESFPLQKDRNKFNLGDGLDTVYSKLKVDQLPTLLADGTYEAEDESDYSQEILLSDKDMTFFQNDDFNDGKPLVGFAFANGDDILNYTLTFDSAIAVESDSDINIMGKKYYIAENTSNSITLLDASGSQRINEGETKTVEATNGKTYTVKLDYVEEEKSESDEPNVNFIVDDVAIDSMEPGDTEEIEAGVYIVVDKADYIDSSTRTSYAQFSLGTGKLYLEDGQEVELNDDPLSSIDEYDQHIVTANLSLSGGKLKSVTLNWAAGDDLWFAPGTDLVMPGFGSVKLSMGEFQHGDYESTTLEGSGDALYLKTEIKDGKVSIPLLYHESGSVAGLGKDSDEILVTNGSSGSSVPIHLDATKDPTFVASWYSSDEGESHAFKLKKVDYISSTGKTEVTLDDLAPGKADVVFTNITEDVDVGEITLTLTAASESSDTADITVTPSGSASDTVYLDRVITAAGLTMLLPVLNYTGNPVSPQVNGSTISTASSWRAVFKEEDKDDKIAASSGAGTFNVSFTVSDSDGFEPNTVTAPPTLIETEDNSDQYITYVSSDMATKIEMDKPSSGVNTIDISYPASQSFAEVMVAESGATVSGGSSGNIVPIYDTEAASITGKNLIVVGGSCVNTLAASLLGLPANSCGSAWQTKTTVGAGSFLIQTFARDGGKVATLVAGYNMEDTANAVKALKTDATIDITAGKKFVGNVNSVAAVTVA